MLQLGEVSTADVTEDQLKKWCDKFVGKKKMTVIVSGMDSELSRYPRLDVSEIDLERRIAKIFSDSKAILRKEGVFEIVKENPEIVCRHVFGALMPAKLRTRIEMDIDSTHRDLKQDWAKLYKHVSAEAEHCKRFLPCKNAFKGHSSSAEKRAAQNSASTTD